MSSKKDFAKRLLLNRSASSDAEKSMLLKLKEGGYLSAVAAPILRLTATGQNADLLSPLNLRRWPRISIWRVALSLSCRYGEKAEAGLQSVRGYHEGV